jgi:hypothetical protein
MIFRYKVREYPPALTPVFRLIDPWLPPTPFSIIAILRKWDRQGHMLALDAKTASLRKLQGDLPLYKFRLHRRTTPIG